MTQEEIKERNRKAKKRQYDRDPAAFRARCARWNNKNPNWYRGYQMTEYWPNLKPLEAWAEYEKLVAAQGGVCAICKLAETNVVSKKNPKVRILSVDHCHKTGKIRGLLCHACNVGIGHFEDDPSLIDRAIQYLKGSYASR